ncbi:DUF58 domain-containing protein [Granulicoccus sp. GXG6511]|uniref:DUF58 domain-containing protein n=1 Tax=Granulicoccus sp. GXG6511 TaxID=3381351 RepID=UPI003D7D95EB
MPTTLDLRRGIGPVSRWGLVIGLTGAVLLVLGLWWQYATLLGIGVALLAALALDVAMVVRRPDLEVHRSVEPKIVERHGDCWTTLQVAGRRPKGARIALSDRVGSHTEQVAVTGDMVRYRVPTAHRGLLTVGPLSVHRVGWFGLAVATVTQGATDHVRVLPRLVPVHHLPRGRRRSAVGADESAEHGGTDLVGLHEYVAGDDLRRLHGPTSARTGQLMVRDDAEPAMPHLTIVLDDTAAHYVDHGAGDHHFEDAVEVAFALCRLAEELDQPVHLVTMSGVVDESVAETVHAGPDRQRVRIALAEVRPSTGDAEVADEAVRGLRLARGLDTVAVISGAEAPVEVFAGIAARGTTGVLLLLHPHPPTAATVGAVSILRAPGSVDLTRLWDRAVG